MTQVENDLTNPVLLFIVQFLKGFSEPTSRWVIATVQLAQPAMSYELFEEVKISNFSSGRNHFSGHQRGFDSIHSQKIGKNLIRYQKYSNRGSDRMKSLCYTSSSLHLSFITSKEAAMITTA
jgi:hypothetical protein